MDRASLWIRVRGRRRLAIVFCLTGLFLLVEIAGAWWTGSLALLADAGHMLSDVGAIGVALFASWYSTKPPTPQRSYGYYRGEILAALLNGLTLILIAIFVAYEAVQRFQQPPEIKSLPMLVVAAVGLVVNVAGARLLWDVRGTSINLQGAFLHVVGDGLGSLGAIAAATVMLLTGWYLADPVVSIAISLILVVSAWSLLGHTIAILMEATPKEIDLMRVRQAILAVNGVEAVHDLHIWTLTTGFVALSAHVVVPSLSNIAEGQRVLVALREELKHSFAIDHATVQLETKDFPDEPVHCAGDPRCLA